MVMTLFFFMWSCTKENLEPEGNWELSSPSVGTPAANASIMLDESTPGKEVTFTWDAASSSAGYGVYYTVVIDTLGSTNFESPILSLPSGNGGKDLTLSIAYSKIDEALSLAGYPANTQVKVSWAVIASSLSKSTTDAVDITFTRFATEIIPTKLFISGDATENGTDLSLAIPLRRLNGADKQPSNKHEIYTSLKAGKSYKFYSEQSMPAHQYGGAEGNLVKSGSAIVADEDGQYRISVDLDNNTYSLLKIDKWSIVGTPINGGWGGDEPLEYKGGGIWQGIIEFLDLGGYVFRANGDWAYLMKHVVGSNNSVIMESQAAEQGVEFEDCQAAKKGTFIVTLNLSADAYDYTIERDPNSSVVTTPDKLFLLANGSKVYEFTKNGDSYSSDIYLALQSNVAYTLNSAEDGSGTSYILDIAVGVTTSPDGDKVSGSAILIEDAGDVTIDHDQAYKIDFDFASAKMTWSYYNIKIFHWDELGGGWDARTETPMTYVHPYKFTASGVTLNAGYDTKFNSPWDIQFGVDTNNGDVENALSGSTTNGGSNFRNILAGTYSATLTVSDDYTVGTYTFN